MGSWEVGQGRARSRPGGLRVDRAVGRVPVPARPAPQIVAVAHHIGLAERPEQRHARLVRAGEPHPQGVRAGDQGGQIGVTATSRQVWQAEVRPPDDGAGEPVEPGVLHVGEELGRGPRLQPLLGERADLADHPAGADEDTGDQGRHEPPEHGCAGEDRHLTIVRCRLREP